MVDDLEQDSSNIVESSIDQNNFLIGESDELNSKTLNAIFERLQANDKAIAGRFKEAPGVWFCKWYNAIKGRGAGRGYNRGDFFWLNTEDITNFIKDNAKKIRDVANANPFLTSKLPPWRNNDEEVFTQYYAVLTGYMNVEMSKALPSMYEIGNLSNDFQLIVSQKDNNTDPISELSSWKRFAVNSSKDHEDMLFTIGDLTILAISAHEDSYHFGGTSKETDPTPEDFTNLSNYADEDFSNVQFLYPENYIQNNFESIGMDIVDSYVRRPYSDRTLSGFGIEQTWFRKWKSGFLEHGGIINVENYRNSYGDLVVVPFNWSLLDKGSKYYRLDYLGNSKGDEITIDESHQDPPGDNLISVLHELNILMVNGSDHAPTYYSNDYKVILTPIEQQFTVENAIGNRESYQDMGNYIQIENVLNTCVDPTRCTKEHFVFQYNGNNTPRYYSYYVRGFCK